MITAAMYEWYCMVVCVDDLRIPGFIWLVQPTLENWVMEQEE